jgi:hypothetical protein
VVNKNLIGAVVVGIMIAALLLQGCAETAPTEPAAPAPEEKGPVMLAGLKCAGDNIEGTVTNVIDEDVDVSNLRVLLNGKVINSAMLGCDKTTLKPGDSTKCMSLQGILPVTGDNTVAVVMGSETGQASVTC